MRNAHARALLSLLIVPVAACGEDGGGSSTPDGNTSADAPTTADAPVTIDSQVLPDAPTVNYDFTCMGNSAPDQATATVTLSGTAQELALNGFSPSIQAAAGASITACKANCQGQNNLGTTTANAGGAFTTAALTTGGSPLDGHLSATKTGNWPTLLYPASPIVADQPDVPVLMITTAAVGLIGLVAPGGQSQSNNNGIVGMFVTDCANTPISSGATVTFTQGTTAITSIIDAGQFSGDAAGAFIALNVPPGDVTVAATYNGQALRAHVVPSVAGTVTTTQIRPGY